MILTEKEKLVISDTEFLKTKIAVMDKMHNLFSEVRKTLKSSIEKTNFEFPSEIDINNGKIFKGENYNSLPYTILDFPKLFSKSDTFTFRTMFYWGSFFSSTIHISGHSLEKYESYLKKNLHSLIDEQVYFCVHNNPWEYHYDIDNYILLNNKKLNLIENRKFIKISKKFDLEQYQILPFLVDDYFKKILKLFYNE